MPNCDLCGSIVPYASNMARHRQTVACQLAHVRSKLDASEKANEQLREEMIQLREELAGAKTEAKSMGRIVEKAALRPTTTNTVNNRSRDNYLQYLSSEPINFSTLRTEMPKLVTAESVMRGPRRFNTMIATAILEDSEGRSKLVCTDQARKQFTYKDEKSGELVSDPSLERLREKMRVGIHYGTLFDEVLEELNACGGERIGNAEQAHLILRRARFPDKFVTHMAKRTYKGAIVRFEDDP